MPLVRISIRTGETDIYKQALATGVYEALREAFKIPEKDNFVLIHEHDAATFIYDPSYLDIARDDRLVIVQITANNTRTVEQKQALYKAIADNLESGAGVEPRNVLINLIDVPKENWSFGDGVAQYA
ncbi:tautomerase family protein [Hansschlegelia plantiphila]|uniref:Tautomerase family protein n=1 Tax=Hansschlegelia plantiphila TaxID=374655 RepID=A0A9W6IYQ1_9HYPH|nr:tautomerase family protein [Hansschlegelia plantiphila]GLK67487.1 tautomerase family protein [Hansschlegelia plantiphila]